MNRDRILKEALQHQTLLKAYAFTRLHDWALAEDAVQDALVTISNRWQDYDSSRPLLPWARRIVHFKVLTIIKKQGRYCHNDPELEQLVEKQFDLHMTSELAEQAKLQKTALNSCLAKLGSEQQNALRLFYEKRQSCETIAERLSRSVNSIYLLLSRVRRQLRTCVKNELQQLGEQ